MKNNLSVIGLNLIVLFTLILIFRSFENDYSSVVFFLPAVALAVFNLVISISYFYRGEKIRARSFLLSGIIVLVIGSSSCVAIHFRKKEPKRQELPVKNAPKDTLQL